MRNLHEKVRLWTWLPNLGGDRTDDEQQTLWVRLPKRDEHVIAGSLNIEGEKGVYRLFDNRKKLCNSHVARAASVEDLKLVALSMLADHEVEQLAKARES